MHYLVLNLTIADSIVCFIVLPLEAAWRFTIQWRAGNVACKVLMALRALGYYLSSAILVAICIDRSDHISNSHFYTFPYWSLGSQTE